MLGRDWRERDRDADGERREMRGWAAGGGGGGQQCRLVEDDRQCESQSAVFIKHNQTVVFTHVIRKTFFVGRRHFPSLAIRSPEVSSRRDLNVVSLVCANVLPAPPQKKKKKSSVVCVRKTFVRCVCSRQMISKITVQRAITVGQTLHGSQSCAVIRFFFPPICPSYD